MGAQFAKQLSARGLKVVLISRRAQVLTDLDVGLVVYNAALSPIGPFMEQSLADNLRAIDVNVKTPTALAHHRRPGRSRL